MLARPTTEQILLDCCRELMTGVLPALTDETAQVRVVMIETVLRNMAVRAAHEVAWMRSEMSAIEAYATEVRAANPGAPALSAALDRYAGSANDELHLDDVVAAYCRAGDVLSAALEVALAGGDRALIAAGERILDERCARETEVMAGWSPTGR